LIRPRQVRAGESAVAAGALPAQSMTLAGGRKSEIQVPQNPKRQPHPWVWAWYLRSTAARASPQINDFLTALGRLFIGALVGRR